MSTTSPTTSRPPAPPNARAASEPVAQRGRDAQRAQGGVPRAHGRFADLLARGDGVGSKRALGASLPSGVHGSLPPSGPATHRGAAAAATTRHAAEARTSDDTAAAKPLGARASHDDADRSLLAPFVPPSSVLAAPLSTAPIAAPAASSAPARAEAAALAERLVRSMRVGKVGREGHEVRLRLDVGARGDVEVRLRHVDGALSATLVTDAASHADAERLAGALRHELAERGIACDDVEVAIA